MNPYDDGIGLDDYVDWLIEAGYPIAARRATTPTGCSGSRPTLRALPEKQRQASLLPLLHNYQKPEKPISGSMAPTDRFRAAVQDAKIGPDKDIPHVTPHDHRQVHHRPAAARTALRRWLLIGALVQVDQCLRRRFNVRVSTCPVVL